MRDMTVTINPDFIDSCDPGLKRQPPDHALTFLPTYQTHGLIFAEGNMFKGILIEKDGNSYERHVEGYRRLASA